jgi:cadmium resistance protein CadD (predicted permease)
MKDLLCNVGTTDKIIRVSLGLVFLVTFFAMKSWLCLVGLIPIVTGLLEICPLYGILGINTCKVPKKWWH